MLRAETHNSSVVGVIGWQLGGRISKIHYGIPVGRGYDPKKVATRVREWVRGSERPSFDFIQLFWAR